MPQTYEAYMGVALLSPLLPFDNNNNYFNAFYAVSGVHSGVGM